MPKIDRITTTLIDVPTRRGHVLSMTTLHRQSIVLVTVSCDDGSIGIGEGTAIGGMSYGPESAESIKLTIDTHVAPVLIGLDADRIGAAMAVVASHVKGNPISRSAVEIALWDALAKRMGVPISTLFGGARTDRIPVAWTLASGNVSIDISEAERCLEERRHRLFKLKIGKRSVVDDVAHVGALAAALGDRAEIRVDVNQAWTLSDARYGLEGLQEFGVVLVEQPIAANDLAGMAELTAGHRIAVMADESLRGPADALRVTAARAADVLAVKVAQSGGLQPAREVIAVGEAAGIGLYGGTMLEAGVGTAASLQLFSTVAPMRWGTEMFGPLLLTEDILATPLDYRDFGVTLSTLPGIGVDLDQDKVDHFTRDRVAPISFAATGAE